MRRETILIPGGGVGGGAAANTLRKRLDRPHRVVVVDREPTFALAASFLWIMTGARRPSLERLARRLWPAPTPERRPGRSHR